MYYNETVRLAIGNSGVAEKSRLYFKNSIFYENYIKIKRKMCKYFINNINNIINN